MSKTENLTQNQAHFSTRFTISFEIVLIYVATGLIVLTFFNSIRDFFYASLAYIAFFMFLSIFLCSIGYTVYNCYRIFYAFVKR